MSWSLNETQALAAKAARGAGFSWGLAEEAGFAVRWLQARDLPGAAALAGYLESREAGAADGATSCPLREGTALCDRSMELEQALPLHVPALAAPLLILPFAATAGGDRPERDLAITWNGARFVARSGQVSGDFDRRALLREAAECRIASGAAESLSPLGLRTRVPDSAGKALLRLETFAARTYAPPSERSRLTGAGAGIVDQD